MPTGYTAGVKDGEITDFPTFAMRCARNFGALIEMRDSSMDTAIPEEFTASTYHDERLAEAEAEVARLEVMSVVAMEEEAGKTYAEAAKHWRERVAEDKQARARYEAMLAQVREWTPPTPDHEGLKKFMIDQLSESIKFDCGFTITPPSRLSGPVWWEAEIQSARKSVEYHRKAREGEAERARERTAWVRALLESLATKVLP